MEAPLIFIGNRFEHKKPDRKRRADNIPNAERRRRAHAGERGQRDRKHERVLVEADEQEIEQHPEDLMRKDRVAPYDRPAIVLHAGPELQAVRAFSRKVDRKPHAPRRDDERINDGAQVHAVFDRDDPRVRDRQDAPELVHLRKILCKLTDDKAVRDSASAHDQQNSQCF